MSSPSFKRIGFKNRITDDGKKHWVIYPMNVQEGIELPREWEVVLNEQELHSLWIAICFELGENKQLDIARESALNILRRMERMFKEEIMRFNHEDTNLRQDGD